MTVRLRAAALLTALLLLAWPAASVSAHAELLRSQPSANAVFEQAPAELRLWFSEQVEAEFTPVTLIGGDGRVVPGVRAAVATDDVTQVRGRFPALPAGHYLLRWRVLSVDGHPVQGAIPFQVGRGAGPAPDLTALAEARAARRQRSAATGWAWPVARATALGGALLLSGALILLPFVWVRPRGNPSGNPCGAAVLAELEAGLAARFGRATALAAALLFAGNVWQLGLQGATLAEVGPLQGFQPEVLGTVALRTRFGLLVLARLGLALIGIGAARLLGLRQRWAGASLGAAVLLTHSLGGHAVAQPGILPVLIDWSHLLAVAPWLAGLALGPLALFPALRAQPPDSRRAALALLLPRFSRLAMISVGVIVLSGAYAVWLHVPGVATLRTTPYGRALIVKLAAFAALLGFGALNWRLVRGGLPGMREGAGQAIAWLRRNVAAEIALAAIVLGATSVLIGLPPARRAVSAAAGPVIATRPAGDMRVTVRLQPNRPGPNSLEVLVAGPDGRPPDQAPEVKTFGYMPEHRHMTQELDLPHLGGGRFRVDDLILMGGRWQQHVVLRRGGEEFHVLVEFITPES